MITQDRTQLDSYTLYLLQIYYSMKYCPQDDRYLLLIVEERNEL